MSTSYITSSSALLKRILNEKKASKRKIKPTKIASLADEFISQFYDRVSEVDLSCFTEGQLYNSATDALEFIRERKKNERKVRVFNPNSVENGWECDYTVIEILNSDMPFIVDSVSEGLNRIGLKVKSVIHPILHVKRNKKGELADLVSNKNRNATAKEKDVKDESLVHIQVNHIPTKKKMSEAKREVERILDMVQLSVEDWPRMLKQVGNVIIELSTVQPAIEKNFPNKTRRGVEEYLAEVKDFLQWLINDDFTFLGYIQYDFVDKKGKESLKIVNGSELGIFRGEEEQNQKQGLVALPKEVQHFARRPEIIEITKANRKSLVHRHVHMDYIGIKRFNEEGKVIGEHRFLGLFTSIVYFQSAKQIPILRQKIARVLERSQFSHGGYSRKELASALEAFPRDELFQQSDDELFDVAMEIIPLAVRRQVKIFIRQDTFERFISCMIFIPRERFSTNLREKLQTVLEKTFDGTVVNHYTQVTESPLARVTLIVKTTPGAIPTYNEKEIEREIAKLTRAWEDTLSAELEKRFGQAVGNTLFNKYKDAFSIGYTEQFSSYHAYWDIRGIEETLEQGETKFDLYEAPEDPEALQLKIYSLKKQLLLSDIMPLLENVGLDVIDEHTYLAVPQDKEAQKIWIHHFRLATAANKKTPRLLEIKENFETAMTKTWNGEVQNDGFNQLILQAGIQWREVVLLRAYSKYLKQIMFPYAQTTIEEVLTRHPKLTRSIIDLFNTRFSPEIRRDRQGKLMKLSKSIDRQLYDVSDITDDKILRRIIDLVLATLRTNYFQPDKEGHSKTYISFKFDSKNIPELPLPRPYAEIFVYSARVEGVHLRGGKVARGGLRWSDRREDFRTEVLGLVKAQMTKNTVIVPVGSKGGFVVKNPPTEGGRDSFLKEGIECYKTFLRGLLDITDNLLNDKVITPKKVVRYDGDDPYLVVAADKGTATFSDIANGVSEDYGFWLGDAFASGGSAGYDHKKMGITAKGAWVSVQQHFQEMGIDTQTTDFTAIGIGDMGGDVFGNGMLLSRHIRLVGAFNHMHIFLDPSPDAEKSFIERERLFNLPRSSWEDYKKELISKGGGIFSRTEKSIKLSAEIRKILDIKETSLSPEALISAMLKAPVDLLWNGGIGTYVKAESETHETVGDKANDGLRVNGSELRCRVVGEGGNLGCTQLGRIEFAQNGGRINTDFIDNSAGVDCSDHEVNIKIALGKAVTNKKLNQAKRNKVLEKMTNEVSELCLRDNHLQAQAISIAECKGYKVLEQNQRVMRKLESEGVLNREIEFLPSDMEIARRNAEKAGLTRPEVAVMLSYSKLAIYDDILDSELPDNTYYEADLMRYFPEELKKNYKKEIKNHQLRREIIATSITNSIVNRAGTTFYHSIKEDTGFKGCDVARAYTVVRDSFNLRELWSEIEELKGKVEAKVQIELYQEVQQLIERAALWFLRNQPQPLDVEKSVELYKPGIEKVWGCLEKILSPVAMKHYKQRFASCRDQGVPEKIAKQMAGLEAMASACDIVKVAEQGKLSINVVGRIYFEIGARLNLGVLRRFINDTPQDGYWDRLSVRTLTNDLYDQQTRLTAEVIKNNCNDKICHTSVADWCEINEKDILRYDSFISDLKSADHIDFSMLVVAVKRVEAICSV